MELRKDKGPQRVGSPSNSSDSSSTILSPPGNFSRPSMTSVQDSGNNVMKSLKHSKSVEHLSAKRETSRQPLRSPLDQVRRPSNASVTSLPAFMAQSTSKLSVNTTSTKRRSATNAEGHHHSSPSRSSTLPPDLTSPLSPPLRSESPPPPVPPIPSHIVITSSGATGTTHRRPPPAPPKRRKPPAIPVGRTNSGAIITSIRSSEPSPLSKAHKPPIGLQQVS